MDMELSGNRISFSGNYTGSDEPKLKVDEPSRRGIISLENWKSGFWFHTEITNIPVNDYKFWIGP
jgi:hypothetical protein